MFFFSRYSLKSTHSQKFKSQKEKIQRWKKKYNIFTHSLDFCPKMAKVKLFRGNKKIRYLCSTTQKTLKISKLLQVGDFSFFRSKSSLFDGRGQRYRMFLFPGKSLTFDIFGQKLSEWVKMLFFFPGAAFFSDDFFEWVSGF